MSLIVHNIFVKNGQMREQPRDPANKGKCRVRVVTNVGVADMHLQDLPHLVRSPERPYDILGSAGSYIESLPEVMSRLEARRDDYDPHKLTGVINQNSSLIKELVCYSFVASVWYHFLVEPIFHLSWKEIGEDARARIKSFADSICISESEPESLSYRKDLERIPHLSVISFFRWATPKLSTHSVILIEKGVERTKYIWEKDGDHQVTLTPLKKWRWKYLLCPGLLARFQDAERYYSI